MELVKSYKVHITVENGKAVCGHVTEENTAPFEYLEGEENQVTCKKCLKHLVKTKQLGGITE